MTGRELIHLSAEDLFKRIEEHRRLLAQVLEAGDERILSQVCGRFDCPHRRKLKEMLADVIWVLEGTRKAFRSKQIEVLRKRLVRILAEQQ